MMKKLITLLLLLSTYAAQATEIQVSEVSYNPSDQVITFDLEWKNSWKNAKNHDAAWVFVKFVSSGQNPIHGRLNATGHQLNVVRYSVKPGLEMAADQSGTFIKPLNNYRGDVHWQVSLKLDPEVASSLPAGAEVRVYAI